MSTEQKPNGVLPSQEIRSLVQSGGIVSTIPVPEDNIQPSSVDLRLGSVAYRVQGSFLPGRGARVQERLDKILMHEISMANPAVLEKGCVYIIPLLENLNLPDGISGRANPKSSTGRLDVFTRLITDFGVEFEEIPAGYAGPLYVEVVPLSFSIRVRQGDRLNQLRLFRGQSNKMDEDAYRQDEDEILAYDKDGNPAEAVLKDGLRFSVDLGGVGEHDVIGFRSHKNTKVVDLANVDFYDPLEFWEPVYSPASGSIVLNPDEFYILISKERVRIPKDYAAEMVAYDSAFGEFRVHYAGFFDPGFGYGTGDMMGSRAVLEVRSHEVPFFIEDGQVVGRLVYEHLTEEPDKLYGVDIGSSYQGQDLALGKHFKSWEDRLLGHPAPSGS